MTTVGVPVIRCITELTPRSRVMPTIDVTEALHWPLERCRNNNCSSAINLTPVFCWYLKCYHLPYSLTQAGQSKALEDLSYAKAMVVNISIRVAS